MSRDANPDLFRESKPKRPVERRKWSDPPSEAARLLELSPRISYGSGKILRAEAAEYTDLHARQTMRRELVALRRRVEDWADQAVALESDPDVILAIVQTCRDFATVLDDRVSSNGAVDTTPEPKP